MSVLLDTNVVSELIRKACDPGVADWVAGQSLEDLYFSAIAEAALRYGAAILLAGRRRQIRLPPATPHERRRAPVARL